MGADLLLSGLVHSKNKKLNWTKGREVARKLPLAEVQKGFIGVMGEEHCTAREARQSLNELISQLKKEIADPGRDGYTWELGGKVLHIRGGTSWGDDPSEGFRIFTDMYYFPKVLTAIGFDVKAGPR